MEGSPRIMNKFSRIKWVYWTVTLFKLKNRRFGGFSLLQGLQIQYMGRVSRYIQGGGDQTTTFEMDAITLIIFEKSE